MYMMYLLEYELGLKLLIINLINIVVCKKVVVHGQVADHVEKTINERRVLYIFRPIYVDVKGFQSINLR